MNINSLRSLKLVALAALTGLGSCSSYDYGDIPAVEVSVDADNPTWENGIQALIEAKCDNCHGAAESRFDPGEIRDRPALRFEISASESALASWGQRSFVRVFNTPDDPMPPTYGTPLTDREKTALRSYLDANGYNPDNQPAVDRAAFLTENCASVDTAANSGTTLASLSSTLTAANCLTCHSAAAAPNSGDGIVLETAAQWREHRQDLVFVLLTDDAGESMPPGRAANFTDSGQPGRILADYACASSEVTP